MLDNNTTMRNTLLLLESIASGKRPLAEDSLPDHLDPNLSKAYNLGNQTYLAYRDNPEMAQAAQDRFDEMPIVKKHPQYAEMWVRGYRDAERFASSGTK